MEENAVQFHQDCLDDLLYFLPHHPLVISYQKEEKHDKVVKDLVASCHDSIENYAHHIIQEETHSYDELHSYEEFPVAIIMGSEEFKGFLSYAHFQNSKFDVEIVDDLKKIEKFLSDE